MIDRLVKIYNDWGDKNNLQPLESADCELMWNTKLNSKQIKWLEKFIRVWDKAQERG